MAALSSCQALTVEASASGFAHPTLLKVRTIGRQRKRERQSYRQLRYEKGLAKQRHRTRPQKKYPTCRKRVSHRTFPAQRSRHNSGPDVCSGRDRYIDRDHFRIAEGVKTKTLNAALAVVRRILNLAASEWIDEKGMTWLDAAPKIKLFPVKDARLPYPLTQEEQGFLFRELRITWRAWRWLR